MSTRTVWHGEKTKAIVAKSLRDRMQQIGAIGERDVKDTLKQGQPPSGPGEPPHMRVGRLWRSIAHEVGGTDSAPLVRVGTNVEYAK